MNILTGLAQSLDGFLTNTVKSPDPYTVFADVFNAKVSIFNGCTGALVALVATGFLGILSPRKAIFLGACSLVGRQIADESFKVIPKQAKNLIPKAGLQALDALPEGVKNFLNSKTPSLKPSPSLHLNGVVIFYESIPRTLTQTADQIGEAINKLIQWVEKD